MRSLVTFAVVMGAVALLTAGCGLAPGDFGTADDTPVTSEKPFAAGGAITLDLSGGAYVVRASADARIHVATSGHTGNTKVDISTGDRTATVKVSDTPKNNFHATIDIPRASDTSIHLSAGEITIDPIAGNLDVDSAAGNVTIGVSDPKDYSSVTASVKAGDLKAEPFGGSKSGLMQNFNWTGPGKRSLRASLVAGNLVIRE